MVVYVDTCTCALHTCPNFKMSIVQDLYIYMYLLSLYAANIDLEVQHVTIIPQNVHTNLHLHVGLHVGYSYRCIEWFFHFVVDPVTT